jgi:hypothetical protein
MLIKSTIGWKKSWLRKVVSFCCRELGYNASNITRAIFSQAHSGEYAGRAYCGWHQIKVKINPINTYPVIDRYPRSLPPLELNDPVEVLVLITAHESAHLERWDRFVRGLKREGRRDTLLERDTERLARMVLASFRNQRKRLMEKWGESGPGPTPPSVIHQLRCRRCGHTWQCARRPSDCKKRSCRTCFSSWKEAAKRNEFLEYARVARS